MGVPHDGQPCDVCGGQTYSRVEEKDGVQSQIIYCPACDLAKYEKARDAWLEERAGVEPQEGRDG